VTLKAALEQWLGEVTAGTRDRYASIAEDLEKHLGATDQRPLLSEVTTEQVREYLTERRKKCSVGTVNLERKILSVFFRRAIRNQQLRDNPVFPVTPFKARDGEKVKRRAFTVDELRLLYRKAPSDFWKYMIVGGFYTGLRMGDLITLGRAAVDLEENLVRVKTRKTGQTVHVPIALPLRAILESRIAAIGKGGTYIWPEQARAYIESGSGQFSNDFYALVLSPCGLVPVRQRSNGTTGRGKEAERQLNRVSFHSFRYSFVSLLKATGGSQTVARELAGHSSDMMSDGYTNLPKEVLVKAIDALPMLQ
jgi:integrase